MFDSNILDTIIGIVFIFSLVSVASSWFTEFIAQILRLRANNLKIFLKEWIEDGDFVDALYNGPIIKSLYKEYEIKEPSGKFLSGIRKRIFNYRKNAQGPSYICSNDFVSAIFSKAFEAEIEDVENKTEELYAHFEKAVEVNNIPENFKKAILGIVGETLVLTQDKTKKFIQARTEIENWYNSVMERLMGRYKRRIWWVGLVSSIILVFFANVDSVSIASALWTNQDIRLATAASAQAYVESVNEPALPENGQGDPLEEATAAAEQIQSLLSDIDELGIPMFWEFGKLDCDDTKSDPYARNFGCVFSDWGLFGQKFAGLMTTALAASFGSQLWFDLLKRLVNLRGSGPNPAEKSNGKKDG